ncbi:hypothetical protein [Methylobacter sp.]|uniref:hypothetical protein n=1 Tax=Methylobacter sp. TaxID=2051955 RepID=UPI002FDD2B09
MKSQIKHHLNLLLNELDQNQSYNDENPLLTTEAAGIGQFIKKIALEIKDYELVGMAEAICQKVQKIDDENLSIYEEYQDSLIQEIWNSKTWFSATDIGSQLNPQWTAIKTNKLLEKLGFQQREKKGWVMTDKAIDLCQQRDEEKGERPYIQWKPAIVERLIAEIENSCR